MKWIFFLLTLITAAGYGQTPTDDLAKYIWYKYQYGSRMARYQADSVQVIPYGDTALFARPPRVGAVMMHIDKQVYRSDGVGWRSTGSDFILYNALGGTGDTLVNADKEVKWLNPGDGILHTVTGTTITQRVDSSKYATQYDLTQVSGGTPAIPDQQLVYGTGPGITSEAPLNYNATLNRLAADSVLSTKQRADSVQLNPVFLGFYPRLWYSYGNSITQGNNASPIGDSSYIVRSTTYYNSTLTNHALSGTGSWYAIKKFNETINPNDNVIASLMAGFNDITSSDDSATFAKIINVYKAAFVNKFASVIVPAGGTGVTRTGTFTTGVNATTDGGKTTNAATTTTLNDTVAYTFSGTNVSAVLIGGDSVTVTTTRVQVFIDGVSQGVFNTNRQTDGVTVNSHADVRVPYALIFSGLSLGSHTIKIVNAVASRTMYVDYFTTLTALGNEGTMIFYDCPFRTAPNTAAINLNRKIDSLVATLPSGFSLSHVKTNYYYNIATGLDGDGVHPNNTGHRQIFDGTVATIGTFVIPSDGNLNYANNHLYMTDGGDPQALAYQSEVFLRPDTAINTAGYVNVPAGSSYKQGGVTILKYDAASFNTSIGDLANAGVTTGVQNTATGYKSLFLNSTGSNNTAYGHQALFNNTGSNNVGIGVNAMVANTSGSDNFGLGTNALIASTTGVHNVGIGSSALLANTTGGYNVGIGGFTLLANQTGNNNIAIGYTALQATTAGDNLGIGVQSGYFNSSGLYNVAIGNYSLVTNVAGNGNTVLGRGAALGSSGNINYNSVVGYGAGGALTTGGDFNVFLGYNAANNATAAANSIAICNDCDLPSATAAGQGVIGNLVFMRGLDGTGTTVSTGAISIGITSSSRRFYVNGSIGFRKDSTTLLSARGTNHILTIDTATDKVNRISVNNLNPDSLVIGGLTISARGFSSTPSMSSGNYITFQPASGFLLLESVNSNTPYIQMSGRPSDGITRTYSGILCGQNQRAPNTERQHFLLTTEGNSITSNFLAGNIYIRPGTGSSVGNTDVQYTNDSVIVDLNGTGRMIIKDNDAKYAANYGSGFTARSLVDKGYVDSISSQGGTYTPTLFNTTNVTSTTSQNATWTRVGNQFHVSGSFDVTTTLAVATEVGISLPGPGTSAFAAATDLNGGANPETSIAANGIAKANVANGRAQVNFLALSVGGAGRIYYWFDYTFISP